MACVPRRCCASVQQPELVVEQEMAVPVEVAAVDQEGHTVAAAGIVHSEGYTAAEVVRTRELSDLEGEVAQRLRTTAGVRHLDCARQCGQEQRPGSGQRPG